MSDRNKKENIDPVSPGAMLEKLVNMPIYEWSYIDGNGERHVGPMAQDFHAQFKPLGEETQLPAMDVAGVTIAAVQGLHDIVQKQQNELTQRDEQIKSLEQRLSQLESLMQKMADSVD
ncbi:MAG: tail fiber domain-containing protein [Limisphaerales bacterium]